MGYLFKQDEMNPEKASTLKLLRAGMGYEVLLLETRTRQTPLAPLESAVGIAVHGIATDSPHLPLGELCVELRAHLPHAPGSSQAQIPVLFLLSSLAFLEAKPVGGSDEFDEVDGWTPSDFLSHVRFEGGMLKLSMGCVRGRAVFTDISIDSQGELWIQTVGRGHSAQRWLGYVRGQSHMHSVS